MKYLEWNNAIINHYFNPENEEKEVILYFSERIIEEIGRNNFEEPEDGYVNDFYTALRIGVPGISRDYIQRIIDLENKYNEGVKAIEGIPLNYPPYFTYFIAFILPFTSGDTIEGLNSNNFYRYVNTFFKKKKLIPEPYNFRSNNFNEIDDFWNKINYWLIEENNFKLGYLEEVIPPETRKYVGKFAYHILFRKEQEEKLSTVFDQEELLPNETVTEEKIKEILLTHADELNLKDKTKRQIKNEDYFGKLIIKRALKYYNNWDGTNYDNSNSKGFSRSRLVMCLNFNFITKKINFTHYRIFTNKNIPENSIITHNGIEIPDIKLVSEKYSNPVPVEIDLEKKIDLIDQVNRIKYSFKPKEFYIFKKQPEQNEWIQIPRVEYNAGTTLIITKKDFFEHKLKNWFDKIDNEKYLLTNNEKTRLPDNWIAFTVKSITAYPHPEILELSIKKENEPKINFDRSYYDNGNFFADKLPLVWIENIDDYGDIIAVYDDDTEIPLIRKYEDQGFFIFTDEHIKRKELKFKLVSGEIKSQRFYQIIDFKKKTNDEIESILPVRNETGKIIYSNPASYLKGIEPFFENSKVSNYTIYQRLLDNQNVFVSRNNAENLTSNFEYTKNKKGNILINFLSTKGKLSKQDFDKAVFSLLKKNENDDIQKTANYLRYSLQDAGFIDYDTRNGKIIINKPHLLIKPSENGIIAFLSGARDNNFVNEIIDYCKQNNIIIEIQNDIGNLLHPQIIYIKFKKTDIKQVKSLADKFDLIFKKYDLYTQFALASFFPDISEWESFIDKVENELTDFPGGQIFDIDTLSFIPKPEDFDKNLSFIKFININGYKTVYRLWYNSIAYSIEEQQLGIYIYLYLFKKLQDENFEKCKENKGWSNCGKEQELMELARKKTNVIFYDRDKKYLAVPLNCRLPRNLSISIALLNGQKPKIEKLSLPELPERYYIVYKNVPSLFLSNTINLHLLKKGLQSLNQTTINIEL